mmetsp:Transcript_9605/g.13989  ORF Transcript_9605/g.13989 Transcript_9605/m.13989 type:complete len:197 (-) Transcript_9605:152-742(-)
MPAKKKGGGKKKAKGEQEEEPLDPAEVSVYLTRTVESLKHKLVMQTNKASGAEAVVRELRSRLFDLHKDYEEEKKRTFEIAADMTREYKAMKQEMNQQIILNEEKITQLKDKLDAARLAHEQMVRQKDKEIALKDAAIQEMKNKMDEMAREFGEMLKQTLDKMSEKIVITNDYEAEQMDTPIVRTFEDFNLGVGKN